MKKQEGKQYVAINTHIRIMSFNVQHCLNYKTRKIDFNIMADAIKDLGAEIIGLQEIRGKGKQKEYTDQAKKLAKLTGYNYYFAKAVDFNGVDPYGNAILSKYPIISAQTVAISTPDDNTRYFEPRCVLKAVIDVGFPLTVLVTHFGLTKEEQENAADTVMKEITAEKCVLMGDFNVTPENELLSEIRKAMLDTANFFNEPKLSFSSENPKRKIDYIFLSRDLKVVFADIPEIVASDHRPHICDILTNALPPKMPKRGFLGWIFKR